MRLGMGSSRRRGKVTHADPGGDLSKPRSRAIGRPRARRATEPYVGPCRAGKALCAPTGRPATPNATRADAGARRCAAKLAQVYDHASHNPPPSASLGPGPQLGDTQARERLEEDEEPVRGIAIIRQALDMVVEDPSVADVVLR